MTQFRTGGCTFVLLALPLASEAVAPSAKTRGETLAAGAAIAEAWDSQAFGSLMSRSDSEGFDAKLLSKTFTQAQFALARASVLDADDGVRDGITAAFSRCTWPRVETQLRRRTCPSGVSRSPGERGSQSGAVSPGGACLSEAQISVLARVYGGRPKDSHGKPLYSDWPLDAGIGSEGWRAWKIGAANGVPPSINVAMGAPALAEIFTTPPTAVPADPQSALRHALGFLAKAGPQSPWPGRTRPLCPYPKAARYSGSGSIKDAANFRCE